MRIRLRVSLLALFAGSLCLHATGMADAQVRRAAADHSALLRELESKRPNGSKITRHLARDFAEVGAQYPQSAHVVEGFTIGRHHERVLRTYLRQRKHFDLGSVPAAGGVDVAKTFKLVLALHDVGKHQERSLGIRDRAPTLRILSGAMQELGFSAGEARLARALVSHDLIGDVARQRVSVDDAVAAFARKAEEAGVPARDFFRLQLFFNTVDGGSYPWLASHAFARKRGRLVPTSPAIRALAGRFGVTLP